MTELNLKIDGMSCGGCVNNIKGVLSALNGVSEVAVSLENGQAHVVYDPEHIRPETLCEAVENAGFEARLG
jgi:copper chaperone